MPIHKDRMKKLAILTATMKEREFLSQWRNLREAGKRLNIEVDLIRNGELQLSINNGFEIFHRGKPFNLDEYSVFYNGIGTSAKNSGNFYIPEVLLYQGYKVFNKPTAVSVTRDKLKTLNILTANNIKTTPSYVLRDATELDNLPAPFNTYPLIVKRIYGSKGKSVMRVDDIFQLKSLFDFGWNSNRNDIFLIQPFIGNIKKHEDIRVILLGKKVKGSMIRRAAKGDFRTNFSLNRDVEPIDLTPVEVDLCEHIASFMDLEYCGVDFIRTDNGPIFLEVNGMPGYTGMNITFEKRGENFFEEFIRHMASL